MAKRDEIMGRLHELLPEGDFSVDEAYRTGVIGSARAPLEKLRDVASAFNAVEYYLESVTGLDFTDTLELVYHFNCYEPKSRIAVRVLCAHGGTAPTVSDIFLSARWQEREVREFFGIEFANHPNPKPLLLPEDADYHPLRKDFGVVHAYLKREEIYA